MRLINRQEPVITVQPYHQATGEPMKRLALALLAATGLAAMPVHFAITADDGYYLEDHFTFLADYAYAETPPPVKPAEMALASLDGVKEGSVTDEINHAAD